MIKYLLIYHCEDNDGLFSAAIFYDYLISKLCIKESEIKLLGSTYNSLEAFANQNPIKNLKEQYDSIIMTDISFNANYMKQLYEEYNNKFIWLDHHSPIIKASYENNFYECNGVRDTNKSAILCVYEYLYDAFNEVYSTINKKPHSKFPELFRILSGYDSWSYEREGYEFDYVRNVNKGATIKYNLEFNKILEVVHNIIEVYQNGNPSGTLSAIFKDNTLINELHDFGKSLNDYDDICNENIIKTAGDKTWNIILHDKDKGRPLYKHACAIFHQGPTNSTMFKSIRNTDISQGLVFKHCTNGNWVLSMYNINDNDWFHCGEFLKERYNGGGHKGAAGCTLSEEQFINILKTKTL